MGPLEAKSERAAAQPLSSFAATIPHLNTLRKHLAKAVLEVNVKIQLFIFAVIGISLMCTSSPAASHKSIVGTWKLSSMTYRDQSTGKETNLWGKDPIGFLTYTAGGRMSAVVAAASRKISAESADKASSEDQAMLFRSSFAYAGAYSLTSTGVIHHVEVASDPSWIGKDQIRFVQQAEDKLIITGPPLATVSDPHPKVLRLVWKRIE
jgi:hypothetical protein